MPFIRPLTCRFFLLALAIPTMTSAAPPSGARQWAGWCADLHNSRFRPADVAGLGASDLPRLKLKWAFGFPNDLHAFSQPSLIGGRVFVGSESGTVYSLDAATGCTRWSFK